MGEQRSLKTRIVVFLVSALVVLVVAGPSTNAAAGTTAPSGVKAQVGTLPAAAKKIMEKPAYDNARWIYYVADRKTGKVLLANRPDELVFTGSTAKEFSVGTVYDKLGVDTRLKTPVIATSPVADGAVAGNVVLVASGDLALGGRGGLDGKFEHTFNADTVDHVYANIAPNASTIGDPLAGLDELARQVAAKGLTHIDGDVIIDTRLWEDFASQDGPVPPIFVNDNLVDVQVQAGDEGQPATIAVRPESGVFALAVDVMTVGAGGETALSVEPSDSDPRSLVVSGTIAAGHSQLTTYRVPDPAAWARTLFVEALGRAGVSVAAPAVGPNNEAALPPSDALADDQEVASIESPPMKAMGSMILETSYNAGSNTFLCLLAVELGSTDCTDGLKTIDALVVDAGLDPNALFLVDGQGADPASTTPRQISNWMRWAQTKPWAKPFYAGSRSSARPDRSRRTAPRAPRPARCTQRPARAWRSIRSPAACTRRSRASPATSRSTTGDNSSSACT